MTQQTTIFIMETSSSSLTQRQQLNLIDLICKSCKTHFQVPYRFRKRQYCSRNCYSKSRIILHICIACGTEYKPKCRSNPKFCTRECYQIHRKLLCKVTPKYIHNYYCTFCEKWIPKDQVTRYNKKGFPVCPDRNCNNNQLKGRAQNTKFNIKRKNVKRIE